MRKKLFSYAKKFFPLIGIVILIIIITNLDVEEIKNSFLSIEPIYIVIALSLTLPAMLVRNIAWQMLQKEQKIHISFYRSLKIYLIGFFYCSITPGYVGHLMRVPYLKEETGEPYGKLFVNVFIDSTLRTIGQYFMILIGAILVFSTRSDFFWIITILLLFTLITSFYFIKKERGEKVFFTLIKSFIPSKAKDKFYRFVNTFYNDFPRISRLIPIMFINLLSWLIIFSQEYIVVMALGLEIPFHLFILLFPLANIAGFLPITFAGLGVREAASIFIFSTIFAIGKEEILVFTLVGFMITDIFPGFVGFLVSLTEAGEKKSPIPS
ncbi:MAG: flippase-like domain-containing protein [Thermoplasmatales archaeon]|nr:flippase-like domain-containing protein [Thermoplasmatales archaeon]